MNEYSIYPSRSDLILENDNFNIGNMLSTDIKVVKKSRNKNIYKTIIYNNLNDKVKIKNTLCQELLFFFERLGIKKNDHILIVGLGNDNHTADSVGPKTLKNIKVNSYLENFNIETECIKVSAFEPGVLSETGILTETTIKSVVDEIKPDCVILIDSFVSRDVKFLNKTIEITDAEINPGCGIKGIDTKIDSEFLNTKVLVIGVTTAILLSFKTDDNKIYLLSSKDIDEYVDNISLIIGSSINEVIYNLL